jgi:hypothetical protein
MYEGNFKDGNFNGQGKKTYTDGSIYEGNFKDGNFNGQGKYNRSDGRVYEGNFKDDNFNGQGTLTLANGQKFAGNRVDDKLDGKTVSDYVEEYGNVVSVAPVNNVNTVPTNANSDISLTNPATGTASWSGTLDAPKAPEFKVDEENKRIADLKKEKVALTSKSDQTEADKKRIIEIDEDVRKSQNLSSKPTETSANAPATNKDAETADNDVKRADMSTNYKVDFRGNATEKIWEWIERQRAAFRELLVGRPGELDIVDTDEALSPAQKTELRQLKTDIIGWNRKQWKWIGTEVFPTVFQIMKESTLKGVDITTPEFWRSKNLDTKFKREGKEARILARVGKLYSDFINKEITGKYITRFFGLMDETGWNAIDAYNSNRHGEVKLSGDEVFADNIQIEVGKKNGMTEEEVQKAKNLIDRTDAVTDPARWFVGLLEDYNFDGKTSFADKGTRWWLSLSQWYQDAVSYLAVKWDKDPSTTAITHLLSFVQQLQETLPAWQKTLLDALCTKKPSELKTYLSENPGHLKMLQNILKNSIESRKDIFVYGKDAFVLWYDKTKESYAFHEWLSSSEKAEVTKEADIKWNEIYADGIQKGMDAKALQWEAQHIREQIVNQITGMVLDNKFQWKQVTTSGIDDNGQLYTSTDKVPQLKTQLNGALGAWLSIPMIAKWLSFNISAWVAAGSNSVAPLFGLSVAYDKEFGRTGIRSSSAIGTTGLWFIPFASTDISKGREVGAGRFKNSFDAKAIDRVNVWVGARAMLIGWVLPILTVGAHAGFEKDKLGWVERWYQEIRQKMNALSSKFVTFTGTYANKVSEIKKLLIASGSNNVASTETAAENIAKSLLYFWDISQNSWAQKKAAAMLTEFYALQWRNQSISDLRWGVKALNVGLDWIVGTPILIPSLAITLESFKSEYVSDSKMSINELRNADDHGWGNEIINNKEMSDKEVTFINDTIHSIRPDAKPILPDGNFLKIPLSLTQAPNNINIKLDADSMKGAVKQDWEYLYAPRATTYRLLKAIWGQDATITLNIWDNESDDRVDPRVWHNSLDGFDNKNETIDAYKDRVEKEFTTEGKITLNTVKQAFKALKDNPKTPPSCPDVTVTENGDKFVIAYGTVSQEVDKNTNITLTEKDGKVALSTTPIESGKKMAVMFRSQEAATSVVKEYTDEGKINTAFEWLDTINDATSKALRNLEHSDKANGYKEYHDFMDALIASGTETVDVNRAYTALTNLLTKVPNKEILDYIKNKITDKTDIDDQTTAKSALVHKMAVVMSQAPRYEQQTLATIIDKRVGYDKLAHPAGLTYDFYKKNVYKSSQELYNPANAKPVNNMIGYSAFYRSDKAGSENTKWFSLAPLWDVRVYNGMQYSLDAKSAESTAAKDFIINNLKQSPVEMNMIKKQYESKINSILTANNEEKITLSTTPDGGELAILLKGWSINHHGCGTISFDTTAVAYAQWECCNQGIGLQINKINVIGKSCTVTQAGEIKEISENVATESVGGGKFYNNYIDMAGQVNRDAKTVTLGISGHIQAGKDAKDGTVTTQPLPTPTSTDGVVNTQSNDVSPIIRDKTWNGGGVENGETPWW